MRAMEIALDVEESFKEEKGGNNGYRNNASYGRYQGGTGITARTKVYRGNSGQVSASNARKKSFNSSREVRSEGVAREGSRNKGSRTLPYPEYVRRREEGRCFHCGGAYGPGHRCPEKYLRAIICVKDEGVPAEVNQGILGQIEESLEDEEEERECQQMNLSIFSIGGLTQPNTMKLQGKVKGRIALVLINSGASHNFISAELVSQLGLPVEPTPSYNMRLGDDHKKRVSGCCPDVEVNLGNYMLKEAFFLFELRGVDVIFEVAWLATSGNVKVNWKTLTMNFCIKGQKVQIRRDHKLSRLW